MHHTEDSVADTVASPTGTDQVTSSDAEGPLKLATNPTVLGDVINVVRGFCMGAADTVPGVSGGTVALILGHYQRLVTCISQIDSHFVSLVLHRKFREAGRHIDLRFLMALGIGIAAGIVSLAGLMHWLLDHKQPETFAVFFGLILASVWIVKSYVSHWRVPQVVACVLGVAVAVAITLMPMGEGDMGLPFLFLSASVAICAMILPGISGAFVLLLFGVYHPVTGLIKDAARGIVSLESLLQIAVFASGCAFGLLAFSRLLRWMLEHHRSTTMAGLIGLMIGSVGKLWPLQQPTPETANLESKFRQMEFVSYSQWPGSIAVLVALAVAAAVAVIVIESIANKIDHNTPT
ncbi:DUF368 domain-containing protein [Novipirellula caenicola]|uniref:DUF368 domain-containing protein n=1 Tax=Novipirellula caenicola TaxID=1536901 RepID=A0ABP9VLJ2_9BACT